MGMGNSKSVNLERYLRALETFTDKTCVRQMEQLLADYDIDTKGYVNIYSGKKEDGEVLIEYTIKNGGSEGFRGLIRFNKFGGVYEGWKGQNEVDNLCGDLSAYFIGGLFGKGEIPVAGNREDSTVYKALYSAANCWVKDKSDGACDAASFQKTMAEIVEAKRKREAEIAEAKQKREAEIAEAKQKREAEIEQAKIKELTKKGDEIWKLAGKLIKLAVEQDKPFGSDPNDLTTIMTRYQFAHRTPATLAEAETYHKSAYQMLTAMLEISPGYKTIEERGAEIGCSYQETDTPPPSDCGYEYSPHGGKFAVVQCHSVNVLGMPTLREAGCTTRQIKGGKGS